MSLGSVIYSFEPASIQAVDWRSMNGTLALRKLAP
jgi:hypothetical protein